MKHCMEQLKRIKSLIALLMMLGFTTNAYSQKKTSLVQDYSIAAKDATWCWYADPRAVYHKGKHEKIYYGYISSKGDVVISSRDANTKEIQTFILHEKLQVDDHNVPSILFLPDGKLLTFYTEHNGRFFIRKSKNAERINEWEEERELTFGLKNELICYSHPVMLSAENNRIYMFFRSRNKRIADKPGYANWSQNYSYSDDYGKTWSDAKPYLNSDGEHDKIPYLKIVSDHKSKIHFLFTDGHPKLRASSVYHMYYANGKFHQTQGDEIANFQAVPLNISKINKLYDADKMKVKSWIWDIALDKKGNPVVAYAQYPSVNEHIYHYANWDGKKWVDQKLINSGKYITKPEKNGKVLEEHYSGGIVLDHNNPSNVFMSRQVNEVFEIEHWKLNGKKWKTTALTSNSTLNNIRPYVVDNYTGIKPIVLWMKGIYEHYTRYNTDLLINEK